MIMIEHFFKWVKLVALSDKSSHSTNQTFLQQFLSRFGTCVECLTDQGSKFRREFQNPLDHAFIDHGCRNPTLAKCEDETHTPKVGDLEYSGTPECLEFDNRGQTPRIGVFLVSLERS
jgi:hypothetical protein